MRRHKPILLVATADDHPNSCTGLCPPDGVPLDQGGFYMPSPGQLWLWDCWIDLWQRIAKLKRQLKARVVWNHVGDGADDNTHSKHGLITVNQDVIVDTAEAVKRRGLQVADVLYIVRGTESHTGGAAHLEELIAQRLQAEPDPEIPTNRSRWYWRLNLNGVKVFLRHKPDSNSIRYYTRGGGANRTAVQVEMAATRAADDIPDLAVYAHVHHFEDSGANHPTRVLFCPPFCLRGNYAAAMFYAEPVGALVIVCEDGRYRVLPPRDWMYRPKESEWISPP